VAQVAGGQVGYRPSRIADGHAGRPWRGWSVIKVGAATTAPHLSPEPKRSVPPAQLSAGPHWGLSVDLGEKTPESQYKITKVGMEQNGKPLLSAKRRD